MHLGFMCTQHRISAKKHDTIGPYLKCLTCAGAVVIQAGSALYAAQGHVLLPEQALALSVEQAPELLPQQAC